MLAALRYRRAPAGRYVDEWGYIDTQVLLNTLGIEVGHYKMAIEDDDESRFEFREYRGRIFARASRKHNWRLRAGPWQPPATGQHD